MRSGKKFTFGLLPTLLALVAMLLASCGSGGNTGKPAAAPAAQQTFRMALAPTKDITTFDPGLTTDVYSSMAIESVFTGLVEENDQLKVTPQLATWTVSPDNLVYTFHLKPNLKFSDGTPLTADDVVYSIDRALSPHIANQTGVALTYLGLIKDAAARVGGTKSTLIGDSLKVVDPSTVAITVDHPTGYFLQALTYPTSFVVEKSVITKWGDKWTDHLSDNGGQGGDGPWMVQTYDHSKGITFIPNPNYYGKQQTLKKLQFLFYAKVDTSYKAFQSGQVDFSFVPPESAPQARQDTAEYRATPTLWIGYIAMNYLTKPFDNIHIRQAFDLAINKDVISNNIEKGTTIPSCHIVPSGMPGYDSNLTCPGGASTKGDPAKAQQLFNQGLQEEGLTKATFPSITLTYNTGSQDIADEITTITQEWQSVLGVTIKSQAIDISQLFNETTGTTCQTPDTPKKCVGKGLQMWTLGWVADYPDPQDWTTLQFAKGAPNNNSNYGQNLGNPTDVAEQQSVQQQLAKADVDLGPDRMSLYNSAEQALVNDVAWLSLDQVQNVYMVKKYVQGFFFNAQAINPPDDWANFYIAAH